MRYHALTMPRNSHHDILFEPVKIGPLTAKNRFFQVPHCNGMGYAKPRSHAAMRGVKAEGGWAVVSTEEVEIHPSSDLSPFIEGRLWRADCGGPRGHRIAAAVYAGHQFARDFDKPSAQSGVFRREQPAL